MKDDLDIPYLWVKAIPTIAVSQIVYTISYYLIYHGFNNLDIIALEVKNELYLKFFMIIIDILIIYFIISGIRSGFFDIFKKAFSSKNIRYIDNYEHQPIKPIFEETEQREIPYSKQMVLEDYSVKQRSKRYLPDYSEENRYYDSPRNDSHRSDSYREEYQRVPEEQYTKRTEPNYENLGQESQQLRKSARRGSPVESQGKKSSSRLNRRTSRKAVKGARPISRNSNTQENIHEDNQSNNLDRNRPRTFSSSTISKSNNRIGKNIPKISGISNLGNNIGNFSGQQQNNQKMGAFPFAGNKQFGNKSNPIMKNQNSPFGNNNNFRSNLGSNNQFGNKIGQQNQQSFFANKLTPNNKSNLGGFGNMNKNNTWNKR